MQDDGRRPVVVSDPSLWLKKSNHRLVVMREDQEVSSIPLAEIERVSLFGPVSITGGALCGLLDAGIDLSLHSRTGRFRGSASSVESKNIFLLLAQVDAWRSEERRLAFARAIVTSKLEGHRLLLQRYSLDHPEATRCKLVSLSLQECKAKAMAADSIEQLRGIEGAAAAAYFSAFPQMLRGGWQFPGRVRNPATDPVNALLSFTYSLAVGRLSSEAAGVGLDPRLGLFHGLRYGRASLPLDLVEEVRAPLADRFVLRSLNLQQIKPEDFITRPDGAVQLRPEARRAYLFAWEEYLARPSPYFTRESQEQEPPGLDPKEATDKPLSWQDRLRRQVYRCKRFLQNQEPYVPLLS